MNDEAQAGLLGDGTYRAHWLKAVMKATHITDAVRVLLLALAMHMDAAGRVSVPREDLAVLLGRNERKVAERVKLALESGLLLRLVRGQKHQVAVYQAAIDGLVLSVLPGGHAEAEDRVPDGGQAEDSQGAGSMHPEPDSQGAGSMHPETQGAGFSMPPGEPAEDSQGAPRGAHPTYRGEEVSDEVNAEDSDALFDLKTSSKTQESETSKSTRAKASAAADEHPRFAEWYAVYPLHDKRPQAVKAFAKAVAKVGDPQILIDRAQRYADYDPRVKRGYIKGPAVWLNNECWNDHIPPDPDASAEQPAGNGSGSQVPPRGRPRQNPFRSKRRSA